MLPSPFMSLWVHKSHAIKSTFNQFNLINLVNEVTLICNADLKVGKWAIHSQCSGRKKGKGLTLFLQSRKKSFTFSLSFHLLFSTGLGSSQS